MSTNAARQNYLQIREQQQLNRERAREAAAEERRAQEFMQRQKAQYNHVPSHGYGQQGGGDVEIKVYVRECDRDRAQTFTFMESDTVQRRLSDRQQRWTQSQRSSHVNPPPRNNNNNNNKDRAAAASGGVNAPRGVVPKYILRRKAELLEEREAVLREAERQREIAKYPPGHRPVSEEERKETLAKLSTRRKELENELHKIPIRYDTQSIKARRSKIEEELKELDMAERKFSAAKQLFVPI